ncbi:MAG: hypothetical protein ACLGIO_14635 [Acidimicrobiia bacterium]
MRSAEAWTDGLLRSLLDAYVAEVDGAPANYSVSVRDRSTDARSARPVHHLHRSTRAVARSRSPGRILRALLHHLDAVVHPPAPGLLGVRALPLVAGGRAVLAPAGLARDLAAVLPLLHRAGFRLADVPYATVDPERAELIVPELALELQPAAARRLEELERSAGAGDGAVAPGRYPLAAWAFPAGDPPGALPGDRGRLWAYPTVVESAGAGVVGTFALLDRLLARVPAVSVPSAVPAQVRHLTGLDRTA